MIHLDLQHRLYLREEVFYKDFAIKTYNETVKSVVLQKKIGKTESLTQNTSESCMSEYV